MDNSAKLNLKELVKQYNPEETTDLIRKTRHSKSIRTDVNKMIEIKTKYKRLDKNTLHTMLMNKCFFLYSNYTHIFNKILKDRIDIKLLNTFINILEDIELGETDQHEASVKVGQILKEIYIDSALKEDKERDKKNKKEVKKYRNGNNISWNEYKKMQD
jgi:hypothetical protein